MTSGGPGRRRALVIALSVLLVLGMGSFAPANEPQPGEPTVYLLRSYFVPGDKALNSPPVVVVQGSRLWLSNIDWLDSALGTWHTMRSDATSSPGVYLFRSGTATFGESTQVEGVENLAPGIYGFHCEHHPVLMKGRLQVVGTSV